MNWKNWPYWIKGGTILLISSMWALALFYFVGILKISNPTVYCIKAPCPSPSFLINMFNIYIWDGKDLTLFSLTFIVIIFLIGALIGQLHSKIKNRKQISS